ncbi:glycosyltransferase [Sphaerisporangium sp. TRM90804]|uniref:glycosyltransferase n=1 Tax=Sphaerisporangium sp. TRM90804 TaxID=3031113 RepID=UPI0024473960|nr:glycosyltransferase [Sphaerisporangium sp. TRM90804]MDH2424136.1 glycosyltransferase [Sphaerisporangium sp. TRM90804]
MEIIARMSGGAAHHVIGLHQRRDTGGFDHRVFTGHVSDGEGDLMRLRGASVPVHRVPGLGRSVMPAADLRAMFHLVRAMRAFRPHVVHTRTAKAGALGRVAASLAGVGAARAHVFHGHLLDGYFSPPRRLAYVQTERMLAKLSDRLVTVGTRVRDDLLAEGIGRPEQYVVIPPGVRLGPVPERAAARAALGLPQDVPVVAYVARLTQVKRPDRFAAVAEAVLRRVPECRFAVCGGGDLAADFGRRVAPFAGSVHLLGWRGDVETVYGAADVAVLTSDNEGTPLTLIEAGMAGLPSVCTRVGSVAEVVRDGQTGLLAGRDAAELAAHVTRLLDDAALARRMGEAARAWTASAFGLDRLASETEALYRSLAPPELRPRCEVPGARR